MNYQQVGEVESRFYQSRETKFSLDLLKPDSILCQD